MSRRSRLLAVLFLAVHMLLLAAYVLPSQWVPVRLRFWSQAYARSVFHQDWRLFAPDPPRCSCALQVRAAPDTPWMGIDSLHHHFAWHRMVNNACRYAEALMPGEGSDSVQATPLLWDAIVALTGDLPNKGTLSVRIARDRWTEGTEREQLPFVMLTPIPHR